MRDSAPHRHSLAGLAALLLTLAVPATASASDADAPSPSMPPLFARFGLGLTWIGGRAGLSIAGRVSRRFAVGGQGGAFAVESGDLKSSGEAWCVGPFGALAFGKGFLFTLGGGYAQARDREGADKMTFRGFSVNVGLHWLGAGGIGFAPRYDVAIDPQGNVPAVGAFTLNLELGPPA